MSLSRWNKIAMLAAVVVLAALAVYAYFAAKKAPQVSQLVIKSVSYTNGVPDAISKYFGFSQVHTYGAQVRTLSDGSVQSVVSFNTGHLKESRDIALGALKDNGFTATRDEVNNYSFVVTGTKGGETIQVIGFPSNPSSPGNDGVVSVSDIIKASQ